jgi:hypothetical protein
MTTTDVVDEFLDALREFCAALHWFEHRSDPLTAVEALADALDDWIGEQVGAASDSPSPQASSPRQQTDRLRSALDAFHATVTELQDGSGGPRLTSAEALTQAVVGWTAVASMEHNRSAPFGSETTCRRVVAGRSAAARVTTG